MATRIEVIEAKYGDENISKVVFSEDYKRIVLSGPVDADSATIVVRAIRSASKAKQPLIVMEINSNGGSIHDGLQIREEMNYFERSGGILATFCSVQASSMGAYLFCMGTKGFRYMTPRAKLLFHEARTFGGFEGIDKASDKVQRAAEIQETNDRLFEEISRSAGKDGNFLQELVRRNFNADVVLKADECKKNGFVDRVTSVPPKLNLKCFLTFTLNVGSDEYYIKNNEENFV